MIKIESYSFLAFMFFLNSYLVKGQDLNRNLNLANGMKGAGSNFGYITQIHSKPESTKGSVYLIDDWLIGNIYLKKGVLDNIDKLDSLPLKYDLEHGLLEIKTPTDIKVLKLDQIERIEWLNRFFQLSKYINIDRTVKADGIPLTGLFESLVEGNAVSLILKTELEVIKANYNVALDVGEKSDKIIKKERLYLIRGSEAFEITNTGKKILSYLENKKAYLQEFVKREKLSYKKKDDIIRIIKEYNRVIL